MEYADNEIIYNKRVFDLLKEDTSFMSPPEDLGLFRLFSRRSKGGKSKEREAYEKGAKIYYRLGVNSDKLVPDNIVQPNSELHRRVCALLNNLGINVIYDIGNGGVRLMLDKTKAAELERILTQEGI